MSPERVKILVVEDNPVVAEDLKQTLIKFGYDVPGVADTGQAALDLAKSFDPDLALLDIHLKGDISGIEVAQVMNDQFAFPFIYLSAYSDNVTFEQAKLTRPSAYLVKPFNEKELRLAIELALFSYSGKEQGEDGAPLTAKGDQEILMRQAIFIKEGKHFAKVQLKDVQHIEAFGSYCKLHAAGKVYVIACNLNKIMQKISEKEFVRVHRSYVVNLNHISGINGDSLEINGATLPVSYTYKKMLMDKLRLV